MMRTPAEQAIYLAERPIYEACARTEKAIAMLGTLRALVAGELVDAEDHFAAIGDKLAAALALHEARIGQLQLDEEVRYVRAHGIFALAAANDDAAFTAGVNGDFRRWEANLRRVG